MKGEVRKVSKFVWLPPQKCSVVVEGDAKAKGG